MSDQRKFRVVLEHSSGSRRVYQQTCATIDQAIGLSFEESRRWGYTPRVDVRCVYAVEAAFEDEAGTRPNPEKVGAR